MFWYPFDIQICTMNFTLEEVSDMFIELVSGDFNYTGNKELDQYYIKDITLLSDTTTVKITFARGILTIFMTIYFTTFLVNFIGHSAMFYGNDYFEAKVSLNVTVMLVQVTMFTSVSTNHGGKYIIYKLVGILATPSL